MLARLTLAAILASTLAACGGDAEPVAVAPVSDAPVVADEPAAPEPTAEPTATDEPAERTADDVLAAFVAAGLDGADARAMTPDDYGMGPMVCPGQQFALAITMDAESNGRLFTCETTADADKQAAYYEDLARESAMLYSHVMRSADGLFVLQLNGELPQDVADQYAAVLAAP